MGNDQPRCCECGRYLSLTETFAPICDTCFEKSRPVLGEGLPEGWEKALVVHRSARKLLDTAWALTDLLLPSRLRLRRGRSR